MMLNGIIFFFVCFFLHTCYNKNYFFIYRRKNLAGREYNEVQT